MISIQISEEDKLRFVEEAREKAVDELVSAAKKNTSIKSLVDSAKSRLTNNLQHELANKILKDIDIESIIQAAVEEANDKVQVMLAEALKKGLVLTIQK